ncbi:2OG-Fe(II) oxygenase family protein [Streptomyces sp. DH24]|uniref:2OG-Fe(II) oxygenase family protein n=1 Tax=Streptomyces sp. DH24 TaxID=3040123 RepID=UPI002443724F|nr:2OG-Fe(II) oxygenase family protein [Streptomyces sp. DH24]MDG9719746.1 2OG-Fe(II) oxygenase family protein [Streptomyces sp. DH24]
MTTFNPVTARAPVALPPMPREREALAAHPPVELERSRLDGERLVFDREGGFERALTQGFFLLRVPDGLDTEPGDRFAAHFHEDPVGDRLDRYRGFRDVDVPGAYQGYFDREHDQWENFYVEKANWGLLPAEVAELGRGMTGLGVAVLRAVFRHLDIPPRLWGTISGGLTDHHGHQMLAFNHFRSHKATRGCKFHRDSGWVTVLRSVEPGLLALVEGRLGAINPVPGHFIVNFGSSLEVLTAALPTPVRANVHGVVATERDAGRSDRTSYVAFLDSDLDGTVYRLENGTARPVQSVAEFAAQEVSRTYDNNGAL